MVQSTRTRLATAALCGGLLTAVAGTATAAAQADPAGNNGTVKVDGVELDSHPDNEPHVGCELEIDFYGFDLGDLGATVTFEAVAPTAADEPLLTDELAIGQDAAGGGTDLDASRSYDLTDALATIEPHPEQGWHVKLTVHAEGSQGADTKFKVFWVTGCETTPPTTQPPGSTTTVPGATTTSVPGTPTTPTTAPGDDHGRPRPPAATPAPPAATPVVHPPDFAG